MAKICLVLNGTTIEAMETQLNQLRSWIHMAEVRADFLDPSQWRELNGFSRRAGLELILTLRQPQDGGRWSGTAQERETFFRESLAGNWAYWDLEEGQDLPDLEPVFKAQRGRIIRSFHDFDQVPDDWVGRIQQIAANGDLPKAAVTPKSSEEFHRFLEGAMTLKPQKKVILAMGDFGTSSRVLAAKLGSLWTYATSPGQAVAPGQLDPQTLEELYGFSEIKPETPVYGIIGNPVFHSQSPQIHNQALHRAGLFGVYLPFLVDDPRVFLKSADLLGILGLSVTIPHKERVMDLGIQSERARIIGACNTLYRKTLQSPWMGENTDAPGFLAPITTLWGKDLSSLKTTVIGNGGAARSAVYMLRKAGAQVLILARNPEKAMALGQEFQAQVKFLGSGSLEALEDHRALIVQTTNVGMGAQSGQDPLSFYSWHGDETAYDMIYTPAETPFLQRASAQGCRIIFGKEMLHGQAHEQFFLFTGVPFQI